jgi:hypothetical protein
VPAGLTSPSCAAQAAAKLSVPSAGPRISSGDSDEWPAVRRPQAIGSAGRQIRASPARFSL